MGLDRPHVLCAGEPLLQIKRIVISLVQCLQTTGAVLFCKLHTGASRYSLTGAVVAQTGMQESR